MSETETRRATAQAAFIIEDWTGRRLFPGETFATFEDGWAFLYANVVDEGDNTFDDYFVEQAGEVA